MKEVFQDLVEALEWYGEQARLARLIHSEGDKGRWALAGDGGQKSKEVLQAAYEIQAKSLEIPLEEFKALPIAPRRHLWERMSGETK